MADNPWTTRTTTDHETIQEWAEGRDAAPAHVEGTGGDDDPGVLRLDFLEPEEDVGLGEIPWDDFFEKFESADLAFRYQNEKKSGEQSNFHRFVSRDVMPGRTKTTTDHEAIRKWAERRDAIPAHVLGTGDDEDVGVLRLDFPEEEADANLEEISWDDFSEKFDRENLAFRYQDQKKSGEESYFHRFVQREETGVAEVVEEEVSIVAVGTVPMDETAGASISEPEMESASGLQADSTIDSTDETGETGEMSEIAGDEMRTEAERGLAVGLVVDEIHEDAFGYDHWNRNDEYLVFRNDGPEPLELAGWTVQNEDGHTYEFHEDFVLEPNRAVTLHSGEGKDTDENVYWNSGRAIWKNTGDVLTVRDGEDRQVIHESY